MIDSFFSNNGNEAIYFNLSLTIRKNISENEVHVTYILKFDTENIPAGKALCFYV